MATFALSFAVYTLAIVAVGIYSARYARRSDEDYFLAGRSLGPWVAALSASASSESGWVTLGLVGWAFTNGVQAYWIIPGCLLGFVFNWFVLAGPLRRRSDALGALTLPDFFSFHFGERWPLLRVLAVIVIVVAMWLYVAAQFAAAGKAFHAAFDGLDYRSGVLIGAGIVLVYTVVGGFRAACWTDFFQGIVMVGTLVVFPLFLFASHGGYADIVARLGGAGRSGPDDLLARSRGPRTDRVPARERRAGHQLRVPRTASRPRAFHGLARRSRALDRGRRVHRLGGVRLLGCGHRGTRRAVLRG